MFERLKSKTAVATTASLVAALGVGGVALAQNSGNSTPAQNSSPAAKAAPAKKAAEVPGQESNAPDNSAQDTDNVQAGDQSTSGTNKETNDGSASENASESAGEQSGSEVPCNDGPGGHADEPGNANADHQETGQE